MSELEQFKRLLANPSIHPTFAAVLRLRIKAMETLINGQYRVIPPAPKP